MARARREHNDYGATRISTSGKARNQVQGSAATGHSVGRYVVGDKAVFERESGSGLLLVVSPSVDPPTCNSSIYSKHHLESLTRRDFKLFISPSSPCMD